MRRLAGATLLLVLMQFLGYAHASAQEPYLVKDLIPGSAEGDPMFLTEMGELVFFTANDGIHGYELWKSDGTAHGTVMVKDINPGPEDSSPGSELFVVSDTLYFAASNGEHGWELWKTDGSEAGTAMVMDINPGSGDSNPRGFQRIGNKLVFTAVDGSHGRELWALEHVPGSPSGPPPLVPESSTLLLMTGGAAGLATYLGSKFRARRRAGTEKP